MIKSLTALAIFAWERRLLPCRRWLLRRKRAKRLHWPRETGWPFIPQSEIVQARSGPTLMHLASAMGVQGPRSNKHVW